MMSTISIWPRSGGDSGNRSQAPVPGPSIGRVARRIHLSGVLSGTRGERRIAGGAVAADGSLRVAFRGVLYSLSTEGDVLWARDLHAFAFDPGRSGPDYIGEECTGDPANEKHTLAYHSLPSIIGGDTLIVMDGTAAIIDAGGNLVERIQVPLVDDSGPAPNIDRDGIPILTAVDGGVYLWEGDRLIKVGRFGWDIVPPAVFADNSFAVAGYAGSGFCRVRRDGTLVWRGGLKEASFLPAVSRAQMSAAGSLNESCSAIYSPEGELLGTYPRAATFAEYLDGGWIALSEDAVARLTPSGAVQWTHTLTARLAHGSYQPLVDVHGTIYVGDGNAIVGFEAGGRKVFTLDVGDEPGPLFPVRAGVFATVVAEELLFIE